MKYLYWLGLSIWMLVRKIIGLVLILPAYPFRAYSRSVVFNYVLQNDSAYLKRIYERYPEEVDNGWLLKTMHPAQTTDGFIKYRKVNYIQYLLVVWFIWGWLDDDSFCDTFDNGYNETLIAKERLTWLPNWLLEKLANDNNKCVVLGSTFDLGDRRAENASFGFWSALMWNNRNTAYNFHYLYHSTIDESKVWYAEFLGGRMGWVPEHNSPLDKQSYKLVIWEKI